MIWTSDSRGHLAKCLVTIYNQVSAAAPKRGTGDDGSIASAEHKRRDDQLGIHSDHDLNNGLVRAIDITHDPRGGFDSYEFGELLRQKHDNRLGYVISNRRIFLGHGPHPYQWQSYTVRGGDPHTGHVHISASKTDRLAEDPSLWDLGLGPATGGAGVLMSGKASWYGQAHGRHIWVDKGDGRWNRDKTVYLGPDNALGVPEDQQGISFYSHQTLGRWFWVQAPNDAIGKGLVLKAQQTDIGPAPWTGKMIDIHAVLADKFGYSPDNFPTGAIFHWRAA